MRQEPTPTEWLLWQALRAGQLGVTFRRQVVLRGYIADFYASAVGLIVEVDGGWHAGRRADAQRDRRLTAAGYRVLRIPAADVETALGAVVQRIRQELGRWRQSTSATGSARSPEGQRPVQAVERLASDVSVPRKAVRAARRASDLSAPVPADASFWGGGPAEAGEGSWEADH